MKFTKTIALALAAGVVSSAALAEEESKNSAEVYVGGAFQSAYIATGTTCNDGWVFQPYVDVSNFKFGDITVPLTLEFWGNMDLEADFPGDDTYESGRFSEIDLEAILDFAAIMGIDDNVILSLGYLQYDYPTSGATSDHLLDFKLGYNDGMLTPTFRAKYRFAGDSKDKCEIAFMIGHDFALSDDITFSLSADCWYVVQANGSSLDDGFACADYTAKIAFKNLYAFATYVQQLDDKVLPDGGRGHDVNEDGTPAYGWGYDAEWILGVGFDLAF